MSPAGPVPGQRASERAYRGLLRVFPFGFRERYTAAAVDLFRDRYRDAYRRRGVAGVAAFWARTVGDAIVHGTIERWQDRRAFRPGRRTAWARALTADLAADASTGWRNLRRAPGFTALAVFTLTVGIGATTAVFSVVSGVLLRPLPYPASDRLVAMYTRYTAESGREDEKYPVGSPEYFDYLHQNRTMESVAAVSTESIRLVDGDGEPEFVTAGYVSSSLFTVLQVPPLLGRTLVASDDGAKPTPVFVLSYGLWQRRFGGSPDVIGRRIGVGLDQPIGTTGEIVGVMPEGFAFPTPDTQMWTQLPLDPARTWRGGHWFEMVGRLAPGATYAAADAEMTTMMAAWAKIYPEHHKGHGLYLMPLVDDYVADVRPALMLLLASSALVLLIACANVANLLLARGEGRRREMAVRRALGAGRGRVARQLLTESAILAAIGGVLGVTLAWWGTELLLKIDGGSVPRAGQVGLDVRVLAFAVGLVVFTTLAFGLAPALQAASSDAVGAFKIGSRSFTGAGRMFVRRALTTAEVALAVLLVIGAGLTTKSFRRLVDVDLGFRPDHLLAARFSLPGREYPADRAVGFFTKLTQAVRALPGVESAAVVSRPPLYLDRSSGRVDLAGRPDPGQGEAGFRASNVMVGLGAFETLGITLRRGRLLDASDRGGTPLVVVIDEEMARRYWPGEDPIGQRIRFGLSDGPWHTIVGVVGNVRFDALNKTVPTYYFSQAQGATWAPPFMGTASLVVRTTGRPGAMVSPLRAVVRKLDPKMAILNVRTMDDLLARALARPRFLMTLVGLFAAIALLLGGVGVYGVMSHGVAQRTNEIGIRMAVGAERADVARLVLGEGMRMAVVGALVGLALAVAAGRLLSGLLFEVSAIDPPVYAGVAAVMLAVGLLASYLPARRAARVDPAVTLRE